MLSIRSIIVVVIAIITVVIIFLWIVVVVVVVVGLSIIIAAALTAFPLKCNLEFIEFWVIILKRKLRGQ